MVAIYFFWTNTVFLAEFIPWYVSVVLLLVGLGFYFLGRHFLEKKYVFQQLKDKIILSTPFGADLSSLIGVLLMFFSVVSFRYFQIDALGIKLLLLCVIACFFAMCYYYFIQLKFAINDKIVIEKDFFVFDDPLSNGQLTLQKTEISEILLLKEFKSEKEDGGEVFFSEKNFHYSLTATLFVNSENEPAKSYNLDPAVMNIDLLVFVEALELMNHAIVRKSKCQGFPDVWMGHELKDCPINNET